MWLPSISEQRAIAEFVDRETAKMDALVAKKERLIERPQDPDDPRLPSVDLTYTLVPPGRCQ